MKKKHPDAFYARLKYLKRLVRGDKVEILDEKEPPIFLAFVNNCLTVTTPHQWEQNELTGETMAPITYLLYDDGSLVQTNCK